MIYAFEEYLLDADRRELRRAAALIAAEPQTFDLLLYLVRNRERVVSKDDLMAAVWSGRIVSESTLSSQIAAVRHAIGDDGERQMLVRTLPRKGFRFVGEVQEQCAREKFSAGEAADTTQPADRRDAARSRIDRPERRQLSVMICNVSGDGAHSAARDPEDLLAVTSAYQDRIRAVIAEHGGFIGKFLGDEVVVYFGYPRALEDDAERAVRAGLAAIKAVAALRPRSQKLQARVAIATGLVVVGDLNELGIAADHAAIGDALPLAAALAAVAEPGALIISATTRRLIGALFDYRDLGPLKLKSAAAPVEVSQVLSESAATSRFEALHAKPTKLIGREEELALLRRRWSQIGNGEGRLALIYGEPGIGKSRLVFALQEEIKGGAHHCLRLQCSPHRSQTAFYPVINQLEHAAGFSAGDSDAAKLGKLEALLAPSSQNPGRDTALFAELLSIPCQAASSVLSISPQRRKELLLEQLVGRIADLAAQKPVLIVLEDAHWIDPTTQELFDVLAERIRNLPVLLIITYRPEFTPPWLGQSHVTVLTLNRLGRRDNIAVIRQVAKGKDFPPVLLEQIVARTDGVPLFIEEMTKSVLESDILREQDGAYVLAESLPPLAVPATLQASLVARLDRLASLRAVVQAGAALGREFAYTSIRAVCDLGDAELEPLLRQLVASELVHQRGAVPHAVYTFKHALVQDAAYGTMLKSQRAAIHARIVETFERQFPEMLERNPDVLAHHCTEAGIFGKAIDYWLKSTRQSLGRSAGIEAQAQLEKAVTLLPDITEQAARQQFEARIQVELGNTFVMTKGFAAPDVATALRKARDLLDEAAYPSEALRALGGLCNYHLIRSEAPKVLELAEPFLRRRVDPQSAMIGHYEAGTACLHLGRFGDARVHLEKALSLYEEEFLPPGGLHGGHARPGVFAGLAQPDLSLSRKAEAGDRDDRSRGERCEKPAASVHPGIGAFGRGAFLPSHPQLAGCDRGDRRGFCHRHGTAQPLPHFPREYFEGRDGRRGWPGRGGDFADGSCADRASQDRGEFPKLVQPVLPCGGLCPRRQFCTRHRLCRAGDRRDRAHRRTLVGRRSPADQGKDPAGRNSRRRPARGGLLSLSAEIRAKPERKILGAARRAQPRQPVERARPRYRRAEIAGSDLSRIHRWHRLARSRRCARLAGACQETSLRLALLLDPAKSGANGEVVRRPNENGRVIRPGHSKTQRY